MQVIDRDALLFQHVAVANRHALSSSDSNSIPSRGDLDDGFSTGYCGPEKEFLDHTFEYRKVVR